jgi:hypothetical protein
MHSLLLGNGINRVAMQRGWNEILQELARTFDGLDLIAGIEAKPLSMFIEELCARSSLSFQKAEHAVKVEFARLLKQIQSVEAHEKICSQFSVIMTTNYDFTIEEVFAGPLHSPTFLAPESRYSLFRRHTAGTKDVWHVHGDVARPGSMVLGFDHYAGYLQKIRNYVTDSVEVKGQPHGRVGSPVKGGNLEFTENRSVYSWVDYFLRDHMHIVGLGLDFTEIDLWWLLLHKRRRRHQTGQVFYYHVSLDIEAGETPVTSLLRSLSVNVVPVVAGSYHDCYLKVADLIERQIAFFPGHHPIPARCDERQSSAPMVASTRSAQGRLKFPRRKKLG